jgi:N-carbamoyl-L-amino-acid hydrolase
VKSPEPVLERINNQLHALSEFSDDARPGWTRQVFTPVYRAERDWMRREFAEAGLSDVHTDQAGNIVGVLPGQNPLAAPIVIGSHTDTVDGGGRFDGIVGVLGSLEIVRLIRENGMRLHRSLVVMDFLGEEPNNFGVGCLGSRALVGQLKPQDLDRKNFEGTTLGQAYERFGLDPSAALGRSIKPGSWHSYVELHIEQGSELEKAGIDVGVVTGIAGIKRMLLDFQGLPDHAGTRRMEERSDALVAAAEAVLAIRHETCGAPAGSVATTTHLISQQDSLNVVPGRVELRGEIRSTSQDWLTTAEQRLTAQIRSSAAQYGVDVEAMWWPDNEVALANRTIQDLTTRSADSLGFTWEAIPSGATHDAAHLSHISPMGMVFVPSQGGRSHCPEEWTDLMDIGRGVQTFFALIQELDRTEIAR